MTSQLNSRFFSVTRRPLQFIAVIALLTLWFTISTGAVRAATKPKIVNGVVFSLQNQHTPYHCLDADLNTIANNGTKVQLWTCNGSSQQNWVAYSPDGITWTIENQHTPYHCLDADLNTIGSNGGKVQLWTCNGSSQQSWWIYQDANGNLTIQNQHAPYHCLDADLNTIGSNGGKVQLWTCNGSTQQSWN